MSIILQEWDLGPFRIESMMIFACPGYNTLQFLHYVYFCTTFNNVVKLDKQLLQSTFSKKVTWKLRFPQKHKEHNETKNKT